jgi:thymidylate synthase (FAD)
MRLISVTAPLLEGIETPTDLIAFCARVSNPENQMNNVTANKLLAYLRRNKHWSPLEMVDATFEIETTRDISRQILRHRSFSFQEFSQRYAEALGFSAPRECRLQDEKNRQNSLPCLDQDLTDWWYRQQEYVLEVAKEVYEAALQRGIAKECARVVLPEGLTMSRLYMKGSIRSWVHYTEVRKDVSTQKEHRDIAFGIADAITQIFTV